MKYRLLLLIFFSLFIFSGLNGQKKAKKFFVTGMVTDVNSIPVSDAMIIVDSKYSNVTTDNNGFFKVKVRPDALMISVVTTHQGIGEALIDGEKPLNIVLRGGGPGTGGLNGEAAEETEEVNIGYSTINRKDLTTPVNRLDITKSRYATYTNMYELLKGAVPGVQVSGKKITIQGASSFLLGTDPLLIVNGVEVGSLDDIQPVMVESVEVLKGASASIYGSRGANGVILIKLIDANTKR